MREEEEAVVADVEEGGEEPRLEALL